MADDEDKSEEPTAKRLSQARDKGQVPKSMDLNSSLMLLVGGISLWIWGGNLGNNFRRLMLECFTSIPNFETIPDDLIRLSWQGSAWIALLVAPMFGVLLAVGLIVNILQFGFLFSLESMEPKFGKVFGLQGLKRLVSMHSMIELLKSLLKMFVVAVIGYLVVMRHFHQYLALADSSLWDIGQLLFKVSIEIMIVCSLVLLVLGFGDLFYQRFKYKKDMRMSKSDVKDESKQSEGDPHIKGKIKLLRQQMHRKLMMHEVPKATVIITNPTFIAIALKYDQGMDEAPMVLAKGKRLIAERIRDLATENNIPIVEDKPLARSMFEVVEVGEVIPQQFFSAIAEILAYVYSMKGKAVA